MLQTLQSKAKEKLDVQVDKLHQAKDAWTAVDFCRRRSLLQACLDNLVKHSREWVKTACEKKGIPEDSPTAAEEILAGPVVVARYLRLLIRSLREIERHKAPVIQGPRRIVPQSCVVAAKVFPEDRLDRIAWGGIEAEVWQEPSVTIDSLPQASVFQGEVKPGKVALVLGGGNVSCLGPLDALFKLFQENEVTILKMHPVNDYLGFLFERIFGPLILENFLAIVYGDEKVGKYLVDHPLVDTIHMTGSDKTYDAIVWGPADGRAERKARGEKSCAKPVSAELGNVSPIIVVPGKWSRRELEYQAENVASMVANNASFNCNAGKLIITSEKWPQRQAFLDALRLVFRQIPERKAYYPGAFDRYAKFTGAHPESERLSRGVAEGVVPWTLIPGVPSGSDDICFREEAFCGILAETALPAAGVEDFVQKATEFCNRRVWGSLNATLLIDPRTEARYPTLLDKALLDLRYGTISVNVWAGVGFGLGLTSWGAYPGHPDTAIESGCGTVHNLLFFDRPLKSVVRAPFTQPFRLPYFATHRTAHKVAWQLFEMEIQPSFAKLPRLVIQSLFS